MSDDEQESHKAKMQEVQAAQRAKVAKAEEAGRGLVLVHTGPGKGKSSSAFGVAIRALGWGQSVGVVQFIKGKWKTGERQFFERLGQVDWHVMGEGFTWDTQDKARDTEMAQAAFARGVEMSRLLGDLEFVDTFAVDCHLLQSRCVVVDVEQRGALMVQV